MAAKHQSLEHGTGNLARLAWSFRFGNLLGVEFFLADVRSRSDVDANGADGNSMSDDGRNTKLHRLGQRRLATFALLQPNDDSPDRTFGGDIVAMATFR